MKFRFLMVIALSFFLAGCGNDVNICYHNQGWCKLGTVRLPTPPKPNPPKVDVVELEGTAKSCRCPQARQFALHNSGGAGTVSWTTISRELADGAVLSKTDSRAIETTDIPLSCTVELTESTQQCQRSTVTIFEGKTYGGDADTILRGIVVATAKADMQSMGQLPTPNGNCPQKCRGTSECLQMDARNGKSVDVGRQIAVALSQPQPLISNSFIVNLTAAKSNVCQRSDIVFEGGKAYNVGLAEGCEISTNLPTTMGDLSISVPRTVSFQHNQLVSNNFELKFEKLEASPRLTFGNAVLQSAYGGRVLAATYDAGNFVVELEAGHRCLAVRVN